MLVQALSYFVELELETLRERFVVPGAAGAGPEQLAEEFVAVLTPQLGSDRERTIAQYTLFTEAARRPELHEAMHAWNEAWWGVLAPLFANLGASEPALEAQAFLAMLDGLLLAQLAAPDPTFEDAVLRPALTRWFTRVAAERENHRQGESWQ
jgi:Tetracyclin repressor-like, C-terminal domain